MNHNIIETAMGAVVLGAAGIFLVFAMKTADVDTSTGYPLTASFANASGLLVGSDVRIGGVLQTVVQEMKPLAEAGGRHLAVLIADDEIVIPGMPELVAILFRNLVGNALKYAPEGAVIEADCRIEGNRLVAEVRDDGPGVPDALLDRLANRFVRGESRDMRGSGLGLEIATRIVRLHGGSLHFANRQPHGFRVRAEWPLP